MSVSVKPRNTWEPPKYSAKDLAKFTTMLSEKWKVNMFNSNSAWIVGSFVYKSVIRGEKVDDLDITTTPTWEFSEAFIKMVDTAYVPLDGEDWSGDDIYDYSLIKFQGMMEEEMHIDVMNTSQFVQRINDSGLGMKNCIFLQFILNTNTLILGMTNSLLMDPITGQVHHIFEVPEFADKLES